MNDDHDAVSLNPFFVRSSFQSPPCKKVFFSNGLQRGLQKMSTAARGT